MKTTKLFILTAIISGIAFTSFAQNKVKRTEDMWTPPTYRVEPAEKAPIFLTGASFQGARRVVYPYAQNDVITKTKENHPFKTELNGACYTITRHQPCKTSGKSTFK